MSSSNNVSISKENLNSLFSNLKLTVPKYQRPYSWNIDKWQGILETINNNENNFFGNIILCRDVKSNIVDIIDGQQRLLTVIILICALMKKIPDDSLLKFSRSVSIPAFFNEKIKNGILVSSNEKDQESLINIINSASNKNNEKIPKKTLIEKCFFYFYKNINNQDIELIFENMKKLIFAKCLVEDESQAIDIFVSMNTKGLPLRKADIVKSKFFSKINNATLIKNNWKKIEENVGYEKMDDFLMYYLNSTSDRYFGKSDILKSFDCLIQKNQEEESKKYLSDIVAYSIIYKEINIPTKDYWKELYDLVYDIKFFSFKQIYPIIAIIKKYLFDNNNNNIEKFKNLLNNVFLFVFRHSTVADMYGTTVKKTIGNYKKEIFNYGVKAKINYSELNLIDDNKIITKLKEWKFIERRDEKVAKFILRKFYEYLMNNIKRADMMIWDYNSLSLEHIIDRKISSSYFGNLPNANDWKALWIHQTEQAKNKKYSIGNFTILNKTFNNNLGKKGKNWIKKKSSLWGKESISLLELEKNCQNGFGQEMNLITFEHIEKREKLIYDWVISSKIFSYS